jgi:hypothetical protein
VWLIQLARKCSWLRHRNASLNPNSRWLAEARG